MTDDLRAGGNPGQGNPGQGNQVRAILAKAIPAKVILVKAIQVRAIQVKAITIRAILVKASPVRVILVRVIRKTSALMREVQPFKTVWTSELVDLKRRDQTPAKRQILEADPNFAPIAE
jgi:hypothetical protein